MVPNLEGARVTQQQTHTKTQHAAHAIPPRKKKMEQQQQQPRGPTLADRFPVGEGSATGFVTNIQQRSGLPGYDLAVTVGRTQTSQSDDTLTFFVSAHNPCITPRAHVRPLTFTHTTSSCARAHAAIFPSQIANMAQSRTPTLTVGALVSGHNSVFPSGCYHDGQPHPHPARP